MLLTIDTDNKTVSVKGQVKFCEVYTQLKKMFPDSYKEFSLKQEVETVPYYPYYQPVLPQYQPLAIPCEWQNPVINTCDTNVFSVINADVDFSSVYTNKPQLFTLTSN